MIKYILLVALGAISYGALTSFAKIAYKEGYSAGEITFAQAAIGAIMLWVLVLFRSQKTGVSRWKDAWRLIAYGTTMGISVFCFYLSVNYIPVSLAIVLLMQISWLSPLTEWLLYKKRLSTGQLIAVICMALGTIMASKLLENNVHTFSALGILLALFAAIMYTAYILLTSRIGEDTPMLEKSALMTTGSAIIILLINVSAFTSSTHLDLGLLKWGCFLAVFGTVIPPICFTTGMPKIGAGLSAVLLTLELPAVVFCAHIILHEAVSILQITGIIVMIGSIIAIQFFKK
ncbi:EamA family transporter [Sphingobacterium sp. MYb382]|uniref:EamA family transporter n=1 Tax=Sphingobacterium sp. MYb382 TaxID=2745278 RepID=UPI0030A61B12